MWKHTGQRIDPMRSKRASKSNWAFEGGGGHINQAFQHFKHLNFVVNCL